VLGQLSRKQQTNGRLDLAARDRRATVVVRPSRRLGRDALEDVAVTSFQKDHYTLTLTFIHRVSKKRHPFYFCDIFVKLHPILLIFGTNVPQEI